MARASKYEGNKDIILVLIGDSARRHAKPPTVRDLAEATGVGVATMHSYLQKLAEEEMVEWRPGHHRSLKLLQKGLVAYQGVSGATSTELVTAGSGQVP